MKTETETFAKMKTYNVIFATDRDLHSFKIEALNLKKAKQSAQFHKRHSIDVDNRGIRCKTLVSLSKT